MNLLSFGGRLRELREAAGLTQDELAEQTGVRRDAVARWEAGKREPSWGNVLALAAALHVECTALDREPAALHSRGPGRPAKAKAEASFPKRPRGRPRKEK